jgi:hypothetical protein
MVVIFYSAIVVLTAVPDHPVTPLDRFKNTEMSTSQSISQNIRHIALFSVSRSGKWTPWICCVRKPKRRKSLGAISAL